MQLSGPIRLFAAGFLLGILFFPQSTQPQTSSDQETEESCQKFVQAFYDWYLASGPQKKHSSPSMDTALRQKPEVFGAELFRLLKEDRDEQANDPGEITGIDFDPFLNSQDPSDHFSVVGITRKGSSYWVDVRGIRSGKRQEHVIPELIQHDGRWILVNFHYGKNKWTDDANLLSILKEHHPDREKNSE
jgi:hypothetical protein